MPRRQHKLLNLLDDHKRPTSNRALQFQWKTPKKRRLAANGRFVLFCGECLLILLLCECLYYIKLRQGHSFFFFFVMPWLSSWLQISRRRTIMCLNRFWPFFFFSLFCEFFLPSVNFNFGFISLSFFWFWFCCLTIG